MEKPTFNVDQLITSTEASKKFGELRKRAQNNPQYITDNGNVDTVLIGYALYEELYNRLMVLEKLEEEHYLVNRVEEIEKRPTEIKSWENIRRDASR